MNARRILIPAWIVAVGAAVATAHGLYEVAETSRVPHAIALLYPIITDGLALVAYASTHRLTGAANRYAWSLVVLAAGVSGFAQAVLLAADDMLPPAWIRFAIGAWPAVAAAVVAHLLYLLAEPATVDEDHEPAGVDVPAAPAPIVELRDPDPFEHWEYAAEVAQDFDVGPATVNRELNVAEPVDLAFEVRTLIADYEARGEQPPGRRKLASQFGTTEHRIRTILDDREAART